ncbi:MAG TPA: hypothetical protein EYQ83_09825 [Acidobacteria bacterium]|nr:hypothetical protein [Acidobacteriota bacterium]
MIAVIAVSAEEASMDEALALAARGRGATSPNPTADTAIPIRVRCGIAATPANLAAISAATPTPLAASASGVAGRRL